MLFSRMAAGYRLQQIPECVEISGKTPPTSLLKYKAIIHISAWISVLNKLILHLLMCDTVGFMGSLLH